MPRNHATKRLTAPMMSTTATSIQKALEVLANPNSSITPRSMGNQTMIG